MEDEIQKYFPLSISFPEELGLLCNWVETNRYPISGYFQLRAGDGQDFYWWFRSHKADERLALFGAGSDGSMYCIWKQDDGREPIVHLGSEGDEVKVLAGNMKDFIALLAIGYSEIGCEDMTKHPVKNEYLHPNFQSWVESEFGIEIPSVGLAIVKPAQESHQNFREWVNSICNEEAK
ncbi:hypothetical protein Lepto7376_2586 [[Leptolyngbya] sp. PCC 7376]|uniref:SMI1/KNR4 family protein n=1 Tax=[Leptolyngbya] sp. PCC 7376 TaxID=111781 RepID=UPI00029EF5BB|nr:SMI1/KNR4 family protein [[Leptolyngbya] sp. PCC 7376]AFY38858.1 hypothetical protein Lepto7376_2586 [[Leptolyngbya] sp. PCC 7376]